jgi:DNA-binding CsgD family transcriptional regulator
MAHRLRHKDLRAFSHSIQMLYGVSDVDSFPRRVFEALGSLVRCDCFAYNEFGPDGALKLLHCEPELPAESTNFLLSLGPEFGHEHPAVEYVTKTGSMEPLKITDFTSQRKWRRTTLYNEFFHPLECEYQIGFAFAVPNGQIGLGFNCSARDYSEDDRQLLALLRPHLMQAYANARMLTRITSIIAGTNQGYVVAAKDGAIEYANPTAVRLLQKYFDLTNEPNRLPSALTFWLLKPARAEQQAGQFEIECDAMRLVATLARREADGGCALLLEEKSDATLKTRLVSAGLTLREAEVLLWVMRGKTSSEIAVILESKTATISKHLEHIYQKLGVENRTAAANIASELIQGNWNGCSQLG